MTFLCRRDATYISAGVHVKVKKTDDLKGQLTCVFAGILLSLLALLGGHEMPIFTRHLVWILVTSTSFIDLESAVMRAKVLSAASLLPPTLELIKG